MVQTGSEKVQRGQSKRESKSRARTRLDLQGMWSQTVRSAVDPRRPRRHQTPAPVPCLRSADDNLRAAGRLTTGASMAPRIVSWARGGNW